jgi:hypothetical protein
MPRDEFRRQVLQTLADRVGLHCSNPECRKLTSGPATDPKRATKIGVAAHITAASPGGPRYNPTLTTAERTSIDNGIWLCHSCATLIDRDPARFPITLLQQWKQRAENNAAKALCSGSKYRPIAPNEVRQELTVGELAAVKELTEEFGCDIELNIHVPAGEGCIRLDGAVVRDEDLVALEIREHHPGRGIPYYQIEYLLELCGKIKFQRFQGCAVYIVIVSDAPPESDNDVRSRLEELVAAASVEAYIRMYRLNFLRAKFGL